MLLQPRSQHVANESMAAVQKWIGVTDETPHSQNKDVKYQYPLLHFVRGACGQSARIRFTIEARADAARASPRTPVRNAQSPA
ncbi:hypothetical protein EVAR_88511_1 [Eumeta japonica]|uniref:Uncharacterized protein n=1 Tax=Eumeta variegata TaxID=151549 RepID=A0A4C1XRA6_EUMVA|nr:hypothetical protein EVAR_88511_1 [Eumeta japonica]